MQNFSQEGIDAFNAGNKSEAAKLLTQAVQQNASDESAWLYLGLALDLPARKRQCFQRVLSINSANQQALKELAALDTATANSASQSSAESAQSTAGSTASNNTANASGPSSATGDSFANPIHVDGAPPILTVTYIITTARLRINQAIEIYTKRDMESYYRMAQGATLWDTVFIAGLAGTAAAAAELIGRLIGFVLGGFVLGLGGLISPFVYAIASFVGVAGGFAVGIWASNEYLKSEKANSTLAQHGMYYALIFLPMALVSASLSFVIHALGILGIILLCLSPLLLVAAIGLSVYNWWLLKQAVQRAYTLANNKAWITAAIAVISSYFVSSILQGIIGGIVR